MREKLRGAADATPHEYPQAECTEALKASCKGRNKEVVASLRKDSYADFLLQQTVDDVQARGWGLPCGGPRP